MKYGQFVNEGKKYCITTPKTPDTWYNYFSNKDYYIKVSQTGQGESTCLSPTERVINRGYRYFYIHDLHEATCWNPNYQPLKIVPNSYKCIHGLWDTEYISEFKNIESSLKVWVPLDDGVEIWTLKLKNNASFKKTLKVYSVFSFECGGMGAKCDYDWNEKLLVSHIHPYYIRYDEKKDCESIKSFLFMFSDKEIASYESDEARFWGCDDLTELPVAIANGCCSNKLSEGQRSIGAFEHMIELESNNEKELNIIVGCAKSREEAIQIKNRICKKENIIRKYNDLEKYWCEVSNNITINTPDENLNYFTNYWLKKQLIAMTVCHRMSNLSCVRNEVQDAMGYALIDIEDAKNYMLKVLKQQSTNGYLQQWHMIDDLQSPRGLALLKHQDGAAWLVCCTCTLVQQTGSIDFLEKMVGFNDDREEGSVYEHLLRAIDFLSKNIGEHKLCLFGDGDWTDPMNGPGRFGRGESVWTTMALKYGVINLIPISEKMKDNENVKKLRDLDEKLDEIINSTCWDGNWYIIGYNDDGEPLGVSTDKEGKLFLNTQTWAIMSGVAKGERLGKCLQSIDSLDTDCGQLLISPSYSDWNEKMGKISVKLQGTTENGSVYCHASMFKAYSDCLIGRGVNAYETIIKTLPTNLLNDSSSNRQVPIFVPNYYFGIQTSPNFGQSSNVNSTGTCSWMLWIVVEHLLGAKATIDGLQIKPCVPSNWKKYEINRIFRKAIYCITYYNEKQIENGNIEIYVDNIKILDNVLPYKENKSFDVVILVK